jgi:hypothetical protein
METLDLDQNKSFSGWKKWGPPVIVAVKAGGSKWEIIADEARS